MGNRIKDILEILYAVTLLEFHDKNWLSGDNESRNKEKQELLKEAILKVEKTDIGKNIINPEKKGE